MDVLISSVAEDSSKPVANSPLYISSSSRQRMTTNSNVDAVYRPLGAYDIRVLRSIMLQAALDLSLYGT